MFARHTGYHCDNVKFISMGVSYDGIFHDKFVVMKQAIGVGGESGAPWFNTNTAVGIYMGGITVNGVKGDAFSKADYLDEALGVNVFLK
jgi:V8-like Glu-specific endopeptidase